MIHVLRRSLIFAAFAGMLLAGCGGGGSTGVIVSNPGGGSAFPTSAGTYTLAGRAGFTTTPQQLLGVSASAFPLQYVIPAAPPNATALTTSTSNQLENGGMGLDLFSVSEYFPAAAGGTATAWGTRYRVYAEQGPNTGLLFKVDLRQATPAVAPAPSQLSSATITGLSLCATAPVLFDNYRSADMSWVVFPAAMTGGCGALDEHFYGIQLSMNFATPPKALTATVAGVVYQVEPVEALYDGFGNVTGYLAIGHPPTVNGALGASPAILLRLDASFANPQAYAVPLVGNGQNGQDFHSFGVSSGQIWLYGDTSNLNAVNLATRVTTPLAFTPTAGGGDAFSGKAVYDSSGAIAYLAVNNPAGSYVVSVNTSTNAVMQQAPDAGAAAIELVGVTSQNVVYLLADATAIRSLVRSNMTLAPAMITLGANRTIDHSMDPSASTAPWAFLVGDTVFFTVADSAGAIAKQAFYARLAGSTLATATAVSNNVSAVLGVVAASPVTIAGPPASTGALVMTGGSNASAGIAAFASATTAASLGLYSSTGALLNNIGTLSMNEVTSPGTMLQHPITGVALNAGPVQAGRPAMLEMFGTDGLGAASADFAIFSSDGMSTPFQLLSGFAQ